MKRLFIAEKSSLAQAVVAVLPGAPERKGIATKVGDDYFIPLAGHILEQAMPDEYLPDDVPLNKAGNKVWRACDLPIVPPEWILHPCDDKQATVNAIATLLPQVDEVIHLGDPDAEGQLLVDEVLMFVGNSKPVRRLLVDDYNEKKVREALATMRDNDEPQFRAWYRWALARSHYDWLIGLNTTRAATIRARELGYDGGPLTAGSVQTPTLKLVVDRDRAIENFKPILFFTLSAAFTHELGEFRANWKAGEEQGGLDDAGRLVDATIAQEVAVRLSGKAGTVTAYEKAERKEAPPVTLSLHELTMIAVAKYGYTGTEILDAAQALYEQYKVTSYPRTDNRYLYDVKHEDAPAVMAALAQNVPALAELIKGADLARKSSAFNDKKMEGHSHHGIIPTEGVADLSGLSEIERNVYDLIVRSYIAQFYPAAVFMQTKVEVTVDGECFRANGKTPVSAGWRDVYALPDEDAADSNADSGDDSASGKQTLPAMKEGDAASCRQCDVANRKTTPPARFDEATLRAAMVDLHKYVTDPAAKARLKEGAGIGTQATQASIVEGLRERAFLTPVKGSKTKFMSSSPARALIDALPGPVKDPAMAGMFKLALDAVASGAMTYEAFMERNVAFITKVVGQLRTAAMNLPVAPSVPCPKCKVGLLRKLKSEKGPFWGCSNFQADPKCTASYPDNDGQPDFTVKPKVKGKGFGFKKPVGA
ncbi:DNA topoisomerase [Paraburkholderia susongensis]|uniref:DNA topoisomerase n=1 Tax=Paraburkholderia susongensis TaxID=1515439 RepID=A0A1X7M695_9BURK|nr:DNA topoisomerase [Paraburkholderia susongensis]SMG61571.1 DNA topoisomerase-3 [Paraburkholderia susongensis]